MYGDWEDLDMRIRILEVLRRAWNGDGGDAYHARDIGRGIIRQDAQSDRIFTWIIELVAIKRDTDHKAETDLSSAFR